MAGKPGGNPDGAPGKTGRVIWEAADADPPKGLLVAAGAPKEPPAAKDTGAPNVGVERKSPIACSDNEH